MRKHAISRRHVLGGALSLAALAAPDSSQRLRAASGGAATLEVQRLEWAGIHVRERGLSLFIDPWASREVWGEGWTTDIPEIELVSKLNHVAITHLHRDHFDPPLIKKLLAEGGSVLCLESLAGDVASRGLRARPVGLFTPTTIGSPEAGELTLVPVPAVDGVGDEQVSWVVIGGGRRILHAGDTLTHGAWWRFGQVYGPFDALFLPVNGVTQKRPDQPLGWPLTMTPEQAIANAALLRAKILVPIHYGLRNLPFYIEREDAIEVLHRLASQAGVAVQEVKSRAWVRWAATPG